MKLYNTLSKKTEDFVPLKKGVVKMYHCGPTVYNFAHIGNLRAFIFDDTLRRSFEYLGYKVKQVMNITDVGHLTQDQTDQGEDKIEEGARREHKSVQEIINFYTEAFFNDLEKINFKTKGTKFPHATKHIKEQINLIKILEEKGFTYKTSDGVYFDTSRFPEYGELGQVDLANLEEGARIGKNPEKRNPTDFALWKFSATGPDSKKREQEWPSPWGVGFPGWHVECSAMSMKYLGETFDIHTGGIDHIPVHHNNEIAQSECATGVTYAKYWLHNAFVNVTRNSADTDGAKMSKSAGNFLRLATLTEHRIHPLAYRYWLLTAHYRSPVMFSFEAVEASQKALETLVKKITMFKTAKVIAPKNSVEAVRQSLKAHLENDLDTAGAIALLHKTIDEVIAGKVHSSIINDFDDALGLQLNRLAKQITDVPGKIKKLSKQRETLRKQNQWAEADTARKELENQGFFIDDRPTGPFIHRPLSRLL